MPVISINIDPYTYARLQELASKKDTSPEKLVEKALRTYIKLETYRIEAKAPQKIMF